MPEINKIAFLIANNKPLPLDQLQDFDLQTQIYIMNQKGNPNAQAAKEEAVKKANAIKDPKELQALVENNPSLVAPILDAKIDSYFSSGGSAGSDLDVGDAGGNRDALMKEIEVLCKGEKTNNVCINALIEGDDNSRNIAFSMMSKGQLVVDKDTATSILLNENIDAAGRAAAMEAYQGATCEGFWSEVGCLMLGYDTQRDLMSAEMQAGLGTVRDQSTTLRLAEGGITLPGGQKCINGMKTSDCQALWNDVCAPVEGKKQKDGCATAMRYMKQNSVITSQESINKVNDDIVAAFLVNANMKKDDLPKTCDGADFGSDQCVADIEEDCKDNSRDDFECSVLADNVRDAAGNQIVQTGIGFSILQSILNPDSKAKKAAELFGFEDDYSSLPDWLKESGESAVCLNKIEGYLDKTLENNGGVTSYGCSKEFALNEDGYEDDEGRIVQRCLEVQGDLRAQMSAITPDNKTTISYSYYIKAHEYKPINYIVALSYLEAGIKKKQLLVNKTSLSAAEQVRKFNFAEIVVDDRKNVDQRSFRITLGGFYEDNSVYVNLNAPVILIYSGDVYEAATSGSNSAGNNQAATQAATTTELTGEELLDLID